MTTVALATEDVLSEALGLRLFSVYLPKIASPMLLRKDGAGYLRSNLSKWAQIARRHPVVVLTDLDRLACASGLLSTWQASVVWPQDLLLRVAVRTAESWLLADHDAMRTLIGPRGALPHHPDELAQPKQHLLRLAEKAPREVQADLLKPRGAVASQGLGYNNRLSALVRAEWSPQRAALRSPSLERACRRLQELGLRMGMRPG